MFELCAAGHCLHKGSANPVNSAQHAQPVGWLSTLQLRPHTVHVGPALHVSAKAADTLACKQKSGREGAVSGTEGGLSPCVLVGSTGHCMQ
jgi:hypothetical protein